jgi:hypothetical protein
LWARTNNRARSAKRRTPPTAAPTPIPALAPVDKCEDCAGCEVLVGAGAVVLIDDEGMLEDVEEVVILDAVAFSDIELCSVVGIGV